MITGQQIRQARKLLKLSVNQLASLTKLPVEIIERAEAVDGIPAITLASGRRLEAAFRSRGVDFAWNGTVTIASSPKPQTP